ncbi:MAG: hypothetical protein R6V04_02595 [bacterium]
MLKKEKIEKEVKKTMDLLKKEKSIKTDSFFYTRLQGRIQSAERSGLSRLSPKLLKWKTIVIAVLIGINLISAAYWTRSNIKDLNRKKLVTVLLQEYSLSVETSDVLSASVKE